MASRENTTSTASTSGAALTASLVFEWLVVAPLVSLAGFIAAFAILVPHSAAGDASFGRLRMEFYAGLSGVVVGLIIAVAGSVAMVVLGSRGRLQQAVIGNVVIGVLTGLALLCVAAFVP